VTASSYPPGYPVPGPPARPGSVTAASYLLYVATALQIVNAILTFTMIGPMSDALGDAVPTTSTDEADAIRVGIFVVIAILGGLNLVLGVIFGVLGLLNGKGKNWARITTWVVGGLSLCCLGAGLGPESSFTSSLGSNAGDNPGGLTDAEIERRISEALPSWQEPLSTVVIVVLLLCVLATIILLALPASNAFFRKPAAGGYQPSPGYPPPSPYPTYPGQSYPAQPSYPAPGQSYPPPGQPYPGQPSPFGQQGQPGDPAPGLPPYPGQQSSPPAPPGQSWPGPTSPPPPTDPFAPPPSDPGAPPRDEPPRPPTNPA
jgi:hypothetical protein